MVISVKPSTPIVRLNTKATSVLTEKARPATAKAPMGRTASARAIRPAATTFMRNSGPILGMLL